MKSVSDHSTSPLAGAIAEDAYTALSPASSDLVGTPATVSAFADAIIKLQQDRQKLLYSGYSAGPGGGCAGDRCFCWISQSLCRNRAKEQRVASVQNAVNLIWLAAQLRRGTAGQ